MTLPKLGHRVSAVFGLFTPVFTVVLLCVAAACPTQAAGAGPGPTVKEVVEFTRIVQPRNHDQDALQTQISPDGDRAFIVTRKADVSADKNRYDVLLLDVRPDRLAQRQVAVPQSVLAVEAGDDHSGPEPALQDARWLDNATIVFRARMADQPFQAYALDVTTRSLRQLTFDSRRVMAFAVSSDLRRVVYSVQIPNSPLLPGARSVVVDNRSFWSVKFGLTDVRSQQRLYQFYVADVGSPAPPRPLGEPTAWAGASGSALSISPDGRWALLHRWEAQRQLEWARQYPLVAEMEKQGPALTIDPTGYFSRPQFYVARRVVAYRLEDGKEQAVVDAPDDAPPANGQLRTDRLWQLNGRSVVIAGTHLPLAPAPAPALGAGHSTASHIIEYWPDTGRWKVIAKLAGRLKSAYSIPGQQDAFVAIEEGRQRRFDRRTDGTWQEQTLAGQSRIGANDALPQGRWMLRVSEDVDQPPDIFAHGPAGESLKLTTLNPQHTPSSWGTMRPYAWKDALGRNWDGGLMVPQGYDPRQRYPLVIQTYGFVKTRFYLDGSNLSTGSTSGFAGRAFLREGILVLAVPWTSSDDAPTDERGSIGALVEGVRSAIDALVEQGTVDRNRIGVMGWSATGERVLNLVTFSEAPIRSASILDGDANTLFSLAVTYGANDNVVARKERTNDALPFGDRRDRWIRNDPSLHTDCITAAMRIETYGPWVLNNWDIYALLRRQYKPVEMVVIPDGNHALAQPSERMVSLQGNVDWHRFWLKDEERAEAFLVAETDVTLKEQYARWRRMAELKKLDEAKPHCARKLLGW